MNPWPSTEELWDKLELAARRALDDRGQAQHDAEWYQRQSLWLKSLKVSDAGNRVTGVTAVLSPQVSWESQVKYIPGVIRALDRYPDIRPESIEHPGFLSNKRKAIRVWNGDFEVIRGPKVTAFAQNLAGNLIPVTVDSQMTDVAVGCDPSNRPLLTLARYRKIAEAIAGLAARFGYQPAEMQAMIWGWHRRENRNRV